MSEFWIGYFTFPAGILIGWGLGWTVSRPIIYFGRNGWSWVYRTNRTPHVINTDVEKGDLWYETGNQLGYRGHWYRKHPVSGQTLSTRWWALGSPTGKSLTIFHERAMSND